jgi:large subunit ribosomal protein L24
MRVPSRSPRRQRRALYTADTFERRVRMNVPLSRELKGRFKRRSLPLRKGDTVRVLSGSFVGREERVAKVDRRSYAVTLENVTLKTAEEKMKPLTLRLSHLVITRLNLSDPWRRRTLRVREEDVTPEERGEPPAAPEAAEPKEEGAPVEAEPAPAPSLDEAPEDVAPTDDAPPAAPPKRRRVARPKAEEPA